jgi:hypothetical protein
MNKLKLLQSSLELIRLSELKDDIERKKLNDWLILQKDNNWLFSEDLAVNFIIIASLFKNNPNQISGNDLAKILKILTDHEENVGGPYRNNLNNKIDLTANIAIAYFLSMNNISLPNLNKLIEDNIQKINNPTDIYLLSKFYKTTEKEIATTHDLDQVIIKEILLKAKKRFKNLNKDLKETALTEIKRTIKKNKDKQMSLISYYFKVALGEKGKLIKDDFMLDICLANIFYWTAFIIYDDFWDEDDKAIPQILPTANLYARHYTDFYSHALPKNPEFRTFFHYLMDELDAANTWETIYCRAKVVGSKFIIPDKLPEYGDYNLKFYPAAGQILGPIAILLKAGFSLESSEASNLTDYFRNYLIAMQINDDAHDYIEDMERGHLSTVVVMLLYDWKIKYPEIKEIDLVTDLRKLQELFWFKTIKTACEIALTYTLKSRKSLDRLYFLENKLPLAHFIDIAENVAKTALSEQKRSLQFLNEFKKTRI